MARLYKRGRIWWAWGYDATGQRWFKSTRQHDKEAARKVARDFERQRALDGTTYEALGLEELIVLHTEHRKRLGRAERTLANLKQFGGHLCRVLGASRSTHTLAIEDFERYWDVRVGEGAKPSTVAKELDSLRAALRLARQRDIWGGNLDAIWPAELVRDVHTPRDRWLTQEEFARLRAALPEQRREYVDAYVYTGARRRELFAVTRDGIDLKRMQLRLPGTKTKRADRLVPIHSAIAPMLKRRRELPCPFKLWDGDETLRRAAERAEIPHVCFNDLRRTFASWLCQAGVPSLVTARLMGHGSTHMVERVYAQLAPKDMREAIHRLPDLSRNACVTDNPGSAARNGHSARTKKREKP